MYSPDNPNFYPLLKYIEFNSPIVLTIALVANTIALVAS